MTALAEPRSARPTLSPAARALRLQRIFARLQEGASYKDIAAEESLSRERLRQIVRAATARGKSKPDHKQMQFARLEPALRLAARGVAEGDVKAIPLLLKLLDRLDRYCAGDYAGLDRSRPLAYRHPHDRGIFRCLAPRSASSKISDAVTPKNPNFGNGADYSERRSTDTWYSAARMASMGIARGWNRNACSAVCRGGL